MGYTIAVNPGCERVNKEVEQEAETLKELLNRVVNNTSDRRQQRW
jgi:hypothetical protein